MDDTGESSASINRRADDEAWGRMIDGLRAGGHMRRIPKLRKTFLIIDGEPSRGGISDSRLRKMLREHQVVEIGLDTFALSEASA